MNLPLFCRVLGCLCLLCFSADAARAHFGMVIPSRSSVDAAKDAAIQLTLKFWHPFDNKGMSLERPASFSVRHDGVSEDLLGTLREDAEQGQRIWRGGYTVTKPGLHAFVMEPAPYFEKAEDCFILHLTKAYVDAFGNDDGWDAPLGLKTEIVPLSKPGALYAGNVFRGRVLTDGKPVPGVEVEVEWFPGPKLQGRAPFASGQSVKTDDAGIFAFVAPETGWWGFAALQDAEYTLPHDGKEKRVELGAVLWVNFHAAIPPVPLKTK
jgi:cobalt/nickel transport protein